MIAALALCLLFSPLPSPQSPKLRPAGDLLVDPQGSARFGADDSVVYNGTPTQFGETWITVGPAGRTGVHAITFNETGTGWQERFLIGVPRVPLSPAPLLVMWHGFGVTELDCMLRTSLMKRAMDRGWYVVAPRGAHDVNFAIEYAQQNIAYVLDWVLGTLDIDEARVYGVGFSMGAGGALSFAARHLDPAGPLFAAVVNHTGTASVRNAHANESPAIKAILENALMFGGTPAQFPFAYSRASVLDLDPAGTVVDPATDLARNLTHVPIATWTATHDPLTYLLQQSDTLHAWLGSIGASSERVHVVSNLHSWRTLNDQQVLDWLQTRTLAVPSEGSHRLLADRDGRWLHFTVQQQASGAYTPFRWNLALASNRITIDQSSNLARLVIDTSSLGLNPAQELRVVIGIADGGTDEIALDGYANPPGQVLRAGQPSGSWSHDAPTQTLTLFESDGAAAPEWRILP